MKKGTSVFAEWGFEVGRTFLGAGPCSAESEEQVLTTAQALASQGVGFLRAGIWKPRTHPGSFEGVGEKGLEWLVRAREETGLKVGTEVADPRHVDACLRYGLDMVWVGARTTTNPFSVQAIADALQGADLPVLVKNPMSPDVDLWMGALERLAGAGLQKLGAIHRGFTSSVSSRFRNAPNWKIPIEFKRRNPEMPLLCDPSHIAGKANLVPLIAQEAMDLLFDGLLVEVHPEPEKALSDATQQLKPSAFFKMVNALVFPHERSENASFEHQLEKLRESIDQLDDQLLEVLGERMKIVQEMGRLKSAENVSVLQPDRWKNMLAYRLRQGSKHALSEPFVLELMQAIHEEAIRQQEEGKASNAVDR